MGVSAMRKTSARCYTCAQCGRKLTRWIYSRFTEKRYCIDIDACAKRARRK